MIRTPYLGLAGALLVAGFALAQGPFGDPARGYELAEQWCTTCHVVDRAGRGTDAAPPFPAVARARSADWLRGFLAHPHTGLMPPLNLTVGEIEALVAHIQALGAAATAAPDAGRAPAGVASFGDPLAGRALAEAVCSACHVIPGRVPSVEAPGAQPFEELAADPAVTGIALHAFLRSSHPTMPNFILSDEELTNIIAYILSLGGR